LTGSSDDRYASRAECDVNLPADSAPRSRPERRPSLCVHQSSDNSLGSLVGFVTVLGIAARNGTMVINHYRHLEQVEGMPFTRALIVRGAEERGTDS
jgi:hypothetical protein